MTQGHYVRVRREVRMDATRTCNRYAPPCVSGDVEADVHADEACLDAARTLRTRCVTPSVNLGSMKPPLHLPLSLLYTAGG